jgi:hypothetical protein
MRSLAPSIAKFKELEILLLQVDSPYNLEWHNTNYTREVVELFMTVCPHLEQVTFGWQTDNGRSFVKMRSGEVVFNGFTSPVPSQRWIKHAL